jgi:hypothetical protein
MKFAIIQIKALSGERAQVYSLQYEGKYAPELRIFADKYCDTYQEVINRIFQRIKNISTRDGIQESFFKRESPEPYHVFRLLETGELRIYCIKLSNIILLFGAGGTKIRGTKKNRENPQLDNEIVKLKKVEDCINSYLDTNKIKITVNGFEGNLDEFEI